MTDRELEAIRAWAEKMQHWTDELHETLRPDAVVLIVTPLLHVGHQHLFTLLAEVERVENNYQRACQEIAAMHAAAIGEVAGARRGVIEDVEDLYTACGEAKAEVARLEEEHAAKVTRLRQERNEARSSWQKWKSDWSQLDRQNIGLKEEVVIRVKQRDEAKAEVEQLKKEHDGIQRARVQPCGCVVCICGDDERCFGCGAKDCNTDKCVFKTNRVVWVKHPLKAEVERLKDGIESQGRKHQSDNCSFGPLCPWCEIEQLSKDRHKEQVARESAEAEVEWLKDDHLQALHDAAIAEFVNLTQSNFICCSSDTCNKVCEGCPDETCSACWRAYLEEQAEKVQP